VGQVPEQLVGHSRAARGGVGRAGQWGFDQHGGDRPQGEAAVDLLDRGSEQVKAM
jgi:hypothetical protein